MKRLSEWLRNTPHLFGKVMVMWCVGWGTVFCAYALRILSRTGHDATGLLGVILAFLGGELLFMCLRNVLNEKAQQGGKDEKS